MSEKNEKLTPVNRMPAVGNAISYKKDGSVYSATITAVNDDGTIDLRAIALNNGQPFDVARVSSLDFDPGAPSG